MDLWVSKRIIRATSAGLPLLLFLGVVVRPRTLNAAAPTLPPPYSFCFCDAAQTRDGIAGHGLIPAQDRSTLFHPAQRDQAERLSGRADRSMPSILAFDIDRDGDLDLVALRPDLRFGVWLNNGRGEFIRDDHPWLRFKSKHRLHAKESPQAGLCSCSPAYEDDSCLAEAYGIACVSPEFSAARHGNSDELPSADPYLELTHHRGPPSVAVLFAN